MLREYQSLRRESGVFADVIARRVDLETRIDGRMAAYQLVTGNFFQMLGVSAALGRTLTPADAAAPGREPVVVLSHRSWQRLFAGDPGVVGRTVFIKRFPYNVVGVAAEGFHGLDAFPPDFWAPLTMAGQFDRAWQSLENPGGLDVIGRLKPGMSAAAVRAGLAVWIAAARPDFDRDQRALGITLDPAGTAAPLSLRSLLMFSPLFLAFGLILLIACANVASLMLARAVARQREIAIRLSLGASRGRVVRQLFTEGLLLALVAAACGLLISRAVVDTILFFLFTTMPAEFAEFIRLVPFPTDLRVAGFLVVAAAVSTVLFGLVPALQATRSSLLQASGGNPGRNIQPGRARSTLIVVQVTASALLLICAGIFLRSAQRAAAIDPGIRVSDAIIIDNAFDERLRPAIVSGMLALVLTLSGIYGVLSYLVVQRTKEIGVRIALGATAGTVTRQVLWQSMRLVAFGLAAGSGLALAASTVLVSMLPLEGPFSGTIKLFDGIAYAGSLLTIVMACAFAASVPALRAARIDPIATLRHD